MVVSQKKLGEFCDALKQYLKNVSAQRDCFHFSLSLSRSSLSPRHTPRLALHSSPHIRLLFTLVTAVRLPDGLSFVVYEFWDGEEEWKSCLVQSEQRLRAQHRDTWTDPP
ncbi:hypothetical protein NHX12_003248 [Muraenolepis orangiensis]|uniref:ABM domain-containing protein n=1 Tax=Muraenolepis orangiensis TaxID=630683 RepID=A0A9Q0IGA5_9TELE|nr:hypothetical protein NHX12_003248 [Muraenolepis orangiensis]